MIDPRNGERLKNMEVRMAMEARMADETWKPVRWIVLLVFLLNWCTWFLLISRHWGMWNHMSGALLLSLSPAPCILMFVRRETYPPVAALMTYVLLGFAFGTVVGWHG